MPNTTPKKNWPSSSNRQQNHDKQSNTSQKQDLNDTEEKHTNQFIPKKTAEEEGRKRGYKRFGPSFLKISFAIRTTHSPHPIHAQLLVPEKSAAPFSDFLCISKTRDTRVHAMLCMAIKETFEKEKRWPSLRLLVVMRSTLSFRHLFFAFLVYIIAGITVSPCPQVIIDDDQNRPR